MNRKRLFQRIAILASLAIAALLSACTQKNTGDDAAPSTVPVGLNRFLLFPNPITMNTGGFETNTTAYADAYYRAIDPSNAKDTITKWKTQNGFGSGTGTELLAVFRDTKDLGYGRRMTGRLNTDTSVAFYVENYNVVPNASGNYSSVLNVEAAINRDLRWHVGTNAIEWSVTTCIPGVDPADCKSNVKFAKYYNFSSKDGTRQQAVDLDGNGLKAMPGPCITCHGGRGDPLTPPDASNSLPRFPLVENSVSRKRGDVQARLHGMNVDSFGYSPDIAGFSKASQQATLKLFNQWILCTYPLAGAATGAEDSCRVAAGNNEWQGTAAEMIKQWYGGPGMAQPNFNDVDAAGLPLYVPTGWGGVGGVAGAGTPIAGTNPPLTDVQLYKQVIAPYCRTCHILRGTNNQNDIDFVTLAKFQGYADRIRTHVFDRGTMPLAKIVYDDFWNTDAPRILANGINPSLAALVPPLPAASDLSGAPLMPGRPIADPGPNRMVKTLTNATLTGENSLFASSFAWSQISGPVIAQITSPSSMITQFNAPQPGIYVLQLMVSNGGLSDSKQVTVTADNSFPDPANIKFAQVKNVLQNHSPTACTTCHTVTAGASLPAQTPPIWYNTFDRNGSGGAPDATDDAWFLKAVQGRVNLTEMEASPILRKPSGNHHNGGTLFNLATQAGLQDYSIFYNWILAGMPAGGVAANPTINGGVTPVNVTFSGSPLSTAFTLDGSTSIGAVNYQWSIVSGPNGPAGTPPSITSATAATTTLNVFNVGTYTVQLQVDDGAGHTDAAQRTIVVNENPITAVFTPGDLSGIFAGNTSLTPDAVGTNGSPTTCRWQVLSGPAGATLDGSAVLDVTKPCTATIIFLGIPITFDNSATLNVPISAVGGTYVVKLTASNIGSATATHTFTVSNSTPTASLANTGATASRSFVATGSNLSVPTSTSISGPVNGSVSVAIVGAGLTLDGSASTTPTGTLSYFWCLNSQPDGNFPAAAITSCPTETTSGTTSTLAINVRATGAYSVRLRVNNGLASSTISKTVSVNPANGIAFPTIVSTFTSAGCLGCHQYSGSGIGPLTNIFNPASAIGIQPPWDNASTQDGATLYQRVRQRVNNGRLLTCPHTGCGGMPGNQPGFVNTTDANYVNFQNWITDGAPPGN